MAPSSSLQSAAAGIRAWSLLMGPNTSLAREAEPILAKEVPGSFLVDGSKFEPSERGSGHTSLESPHGSQDFSCKRSRTDSCERGPRILPGRWLQVRAFRARQRAYEPGVSSREPRLLLQEKQNRFLRKRSQDPSW